MKYVSIDIETTGLDPETCQILSFGAIIEDTSKPLTFEEVPKFYKVMRLRQIQGEPFALDMNRELIREMKEDKSDNLIYPQDLGDEFCEFLHINGLWDWDSYNQPLKVAGKNFQGFDAKFLDRLHGFRYVKIHQRVLDPAPLYVDFYNDEWLPNLDTCLKRANISREVSHNALEDAWDTILTLRAKYNG